MCKDCHAQRDIDYGWKGWIGFYKSAIPCTNRTEDVAPDGHYMVGIPR